METLDTQEYQRKQKLESNQLSIMVAVLPVTSLYAGIHAAFFAVLSLRVAMFRGSAMKEGKQAESMPEFKLCNSVSHALAYAREKQGPTFVQGLTCDKDGCNLQEFIVTSPRPIRCLCEVPISADRWRLHMSVSPDELDEQPHICKRQEAAI